MIGAPLLKNNSYAQTVENKRPNILLIVADDFGWSDLKSYGGDIIAPNLDTLANQSLQFTNFHVMPVCSPTRSVLLTGVDVHKNGMGTMDVLLTPNQKSQSGYETYLNNKVTTVAQILKDNGYHTYLSGKWHVGANQQTGHIIEDLNKVSHYYMGPEPCGMVQFPSMRTRSSGSGTIN